MSRPVPPTAGAPVDAGAPGEDGSRSWTEGEGRPEEVTTGSWSEVLAAARSAWARRGRTELVLVGAALLVLLQVGLLSAAAARGYWYADDLDNLALARTSDLDLSYLGNRVNDHLTPGLRLSYWVFAHAAPMDWGFTVAVRAVLQLVASALMAWLLVRLHGLRPTMLVGLTAYLATPLVVPSFVSLSSAVNLLPSHVAGLAVLHCLLTWSRREGFGPLLGLAAAVFTTLCFWEKSGLILLSAVALVLAHLRPLAGRRLRAWWPPAVAAGLSVAAFAGLYALTGPPDSGSWPGLGTLAGLVLDAVRLLLAPAFVGGPWDWTPTTPAPFGLADPPVLAQVAGLVVLVLLLARCLWRARAALWWWVAVLGYVVATVVSVAVGRLEGLGPVFLYHFHYWSDLAIPLSMLVTASLTGPDAARPGTTSPVPVRSRALVGATALWAAAAVTSSTLFVLPWSDTPSRDWLATVDAQLAERPGTVNLYDTTVPLDVLTVLAERRRLSDVLPLTGRPLVFDDSGSDPLFVAADGTVHPGDLQSWARGVAGDPGCGALVQGRSRVVVRLDRRVPEGLWFARIGYLANPDARVSVALGDTSGQVPLRSSETWPAGLLTRTLHADTITEADRLVITGLDDDVNLCVGDVTVGLPQAAP